METKRKREKRMRMRERKREKNSETARWEVRLRPLIRTVSSGSQLAAAEAEQQDRGPEIPQRPTKSDERKKRSRERKKRNGRRQSERLHLAPGPRQNSVKLGKKKEPVISLRLRTVQSNQANIYYATFELLFWVKPISQNQSLYRKWSAPTGSAHRFVFFSLFFRVWPLPRVFA